MDFHFYCLRDSFWSILFKNPALNVIAFLFANFILIAFLYEISLSSALFHAIFVTLLMGLCELIVSAIDTHINNNFYQSPYYFRNLMILLVFAKQLYFWIMFIISRLSAKTKKQRQKLGREFFMLVLFPLISVWILMTLLAICYYITLSDTLNRMIAASAILLLLSNLVIYGIYAYSEKRNQEFTEMQLQLQKEYDSVSYYKMLLAQDEAQNILIHDIKKHLNSIALLNEQGEQAKISSYITQLISSSDLQTASRVCDHEFLNAILCRYIGACRKQCVSFHTDIRSGTVGFMKENDLTSLFCNLLDNALEAAVKQVNSFIELRVTKKPQAHLTVITMVNSCRTNPFDKSGKRLASTKKDTLRHGYGIKSIKRIVKIYHGEMELYYDDAEKCFHTVIVLKNYKTS